AAVLLLLPCNVDLQQDVLTLPLALGAALQGVDQSWAINRVDQREEAHGVSRLVRLQVADEVQGGAFLQDRREEGGHFLGRVLDPVLAEVAQSRGPCCFDRGIRVRRERLGHPDDADTGRVASRALGRGTHAFLYPGHLLGNGRRVRPPNHHWIPAPCSAPCGTSAITAAKLAGGAPVARRERWEKNRSALQRVHTPDTSICSAGTPAAMRADRLACHRSKIVRLSTRRTACPSGSRPVARHASITSSPTS